MESTANPLAVGAGEPLTMSSKEIADLLELWHNNMKRIIKTLASKGIFEPPQIEEH